MSPAEKFAKSRVKSPTRAEPWAGRKRSWKCLLMPMREKLGLTIRDVAEGTGIDNVTISAVEHGVNLRLTTARDIAAFFGVTVEEMWPERAGEP